MQGRALLGTNHADYALDADLQVHTFCGGGRSFGREWSIGAKYHPVQQVQNLTAPMLDAIGRGQPCTAGRSVEGLNHHESLINTRHVCGKVC